MAQPLFFPNVEIQRAAMSRMQFLAGSWAGDAQIWRVPDNAVNLLQIEKVTYKLDGLILEIEGTGQNKADGKLLLQPLALISFDDEAGVYRMRAFNDGRWLESEVMVDESHKELRWGFTIGPVQTTSTLRISENGDWTEHHQLTIDSQPSRNFMEVVVKRESTACSA